MAVNTVNWQIERERDILGTMAVNTVNWQIERETYWALWQLIQ